MVPEGGLTLDHNDASCFRCLARLRVSRFASLPRLGLDPMAEAAQVADHSLDPVLYRIAFFHRISPSSRLLHRILSMDPGFSLLRSLAASDISLGTFAFPRRNHVRGQRHRPPKLAALARPRFWNWHAGILDNRSGRRIDPYLSHGSVVLWSYLLQPGHYMF